MAARPCNADMAELVPTVFRGLGEAHSRALL